MVAQSFLSNDKEADVALQNGGGCRAAIPAGEHTVADAFRFMPFQNYMKAATLNGSQIVRVIEDALAESIDRGGNGGSYPYAAGLLFDVWGNASFGQRVRNVKVRPRATGAWEALDTAREYRVVTHSFLARGQDGFRLFGDVWERQGWDTDGLLYTEAWMHWLGKAHLPQRVVHPLVPANFSTQHYINPDGCDHRVQPFGPNGCQWPVAR